MALTDCYHSGPKPSLSNSPPNRTNARDRSLAIANAVWLDGVSLFQQVVEIGAVSAVSNAVQAEMH